MLHRGDIRDGEPADCVCLRIFVRWRESWEGSREDTTSSWGSNVSTRRRESYHQRASILVDSLTNAENIRYLGSCSTQLGRGQELHPEDEAPRCLPTLSLASLASV